MNELYHMDSKYFITSNGELYHYGVPGMKWGVRRQDKMREKAEKTLGRSVTLGDFGGGKITNRGIKKVKKYDELEAAYNKVRKKGDPSFAQMHALNLQTGTSLSNRQINNIIRKMDKNKTMDVEKAVIRAQYVRKGEKIATKILLSSAATITMYELSKRYG